MNSITKKIALIIAAITLNVACAQRNSLKDKKNQPDISSVEAADRNASQVAPTNQSTTATASQTEEYGPSVESVKAGLEFQNGDAICYLFEEGKTEVLKKAVLDGQDSDASAPLEYGSFWYQTNHSSPTGIAMSILKKDGNYSFEMLAQQDEKVFYIQQGDQSISCFNNKYCMAYAKSNTTGNMEAIDHPIAMEVSKTGQVTNLAPQYSHENRVWFSALKKASNDFVMLIQRPKSTSSQELEIKAVARMTETGIQLLHGKIVFQCLKIQ
jgi:hypothetical protein